MKQYLSIVGLVIACFICGFGQAPDNPKQIKVAKEFITNYLKEDYKACVKMFDKEAQKTVTPEIVKEGLTVLHKYKPFADGGVSVYMSGYKYTQKGKMPFYSMRFRRDVGNPPSLLLDISFQDEKTTKIFHVIPKSALRSRPSTDAPAKSSPGKETVLEGRQKWVIEEDTLQVRGVNIVHFADNQSALAIQVEAEFPSHGTKEWAERNGRKIAAKAFSSGYYIKASEALEGTQKELMDKIGVSFINPKTGIGYNTLIKSADYEQ